jgi:hypothetical protein
MKNSQISLSREIKNVKNKSLENFNKKNMTEMGEYGQNVTIHFSKIKLKYKSRGFSP